MSVITRLIVISGPSGCGKSTLLKRLFDEFPDKFGFSVSHTTRAPRDKEVDGKDYHFVAKEVMTREVAEGKFIESATYSGNMYGTSIKAVQDILDSGKICMLDIDMQGVQLVKKTALTPRYIFIRPPSPELETLEGRIRGRQSGEKEEAIQARLAAAVRELEYASLPNSYDFVIVNDNLDRAYGELKVAVLE